MDPCLPDTRTGRMQNEGLCHAPRPWRQSEFTGIIFHVFLQAEATHLKKIKPLFTMAKKWKQPKRPLTAGQINEMRSMEWVRESHSVWHMPQLGRTLGQKVKWNKPVARRQVLLRFHLDEVVKFLEPESGMVGARGRWGGVGSGGLRSIEFWFCKMSRVLEMDGGDGDSGMWMCLVYWMPLSCTRERGRGGKFTCILLQ